MSAGAGVVVRKSWGRAIYLAQAAGDLRGFKGADYSDRIVRHLEGHLSRLLKREVKITKDDTDRETADWTIEVDGEASQWITLDDGVMGLLAQKVTGSIYEWRACLKSYLRSRRRYADEWWEEAKRLGEGEVAEKLIENMPVEERPVIFLVQIKDLYDKEKNPNFSLSPEAILKNEKISKTFLHSRPHKEAEV